MIRINLLAGERERPKTKAAVPFDIGQKVTLVGSLILVAAALGIGWWWWSLDREKARIASDISEAQRETARLQSILHQVSAFDKQKQQLQQRVALIEALRKGQSGGVHMLDELSKALPEMLWLTQLKQDGGELTIEGRCTTLTALSDLVANLEHSRYFRKPVEIVDSQVDNTQTQGPELIKFALKATFAIPGMQPAPKAGR
jgi:type IV pilus assembly protein PilN